jgi:hypothetical protein
MDLGAASTQGAFIGAVAGISGVVIGSILNWIREALSTRAQRLRNGTYLAIRVTCILDKYIVDCAAVVQDDGLSYGQRDEHGCLSPQVETPEAPSYPNDLDWKSIDRLLAYHLLAMQNETDAADASIDAAWDYAATAPDYDEFFEEREAQYAKLGLAAHAYGEQLRKTYGIPAREFGQWNPVEKLREAREAVGKRRQERYARNATMLDSIPQQP